MSKAATKAEKIRRKRGRFRTENVPREPNGRISRSGIDHGPADVVALEARRRIWGLTEKEAKDQMAATFIGRLRLRRDLSEEQYNGALNAISLRNAYLRAIKAPGAKYDGAGEAPDEDAYEDWASRTVAAYNAMRKGIQEAQNETRTDNYWAALDLVIYQDQPLEHMVGTVRSLCNFLARFFHVEGRT